MLKPMMHQLVSTNEISFFSFSFQFNIYFIACPFLQNKEPTALPFPAPPTPPLLDGVAYNLHNNVWDTNYIYWYPFIEGDESWRARFLVTFDGSCS
jgi:hypothetical protein